MINNCESCDQKMLKRNFVSRCRGEFKKPLSNERDLWAAVNYFILFCSRSEIFLWFSHTRYCSADKLSLAKFAEQTKRTKRKYLFAMKINSGIISFFSWKVPRNEPCQRKEIKLQPFIYSQARTDCSLCLTQQIQSGYWSLLQVACSFKKK